MMVQKKTEGSKRADEIMKHHGNCIPSKHSDLSWIQTSARKSSVTNFRSVRDDTIDGLAQRQRCLGLTTQHGQTRTAFCDWKWCFDNILIVFDSFLWFRSIAGRLSRLWCLSLINQHCNMQRNDKPLVVFGAHVGVILSSSWEGESEYAPSIQFGGVTCL